ncbi:MAG: hypothetical protein JSS86_03410 [Cyanobacteria bacterium SZAS LIN-2]|nr:hypothetical protein [Cyanobacteria bacterium SZAS LIN-2]
MLKIRRFSRFSLPATVLAIVLCGAGAPSAFAAETCEWLFVQKQALSGLHKIYWTPNAIKIVCETQGYALVTHAPDWRLYAYRLDDKVYRVCTLREFFITYPYQPRLADLARKRSIKLGTTKKDGLEIVRYRDQQEDGTLHDLYTVESPAVSPQVSDLLYAYYRMTPARGVVYRTRFENLPRNRAHSMAMSSWGESALRSDTGAKDMVVTTEVKKLPYHPADFECPRGLRVGSGDDIYTSKAQKKQAESLVDDLNLGGKFGSK